ncbi:MAG: uroporphyrinogen decarboxylase family protein [Planctomycetota bacterium]
MTPKERVKAALNHQEPDRVPVGEFATDYKIIEAVLGRETFYRGKTKEIKALWDGRRDEVVESQKKDLVEFIRKTNTDMVPVQMVPARNAVFEKPKQIDENTYKDQFGNVLRYSEATQDMMLMERGSKAPNAIEQPPPDGSEWELFDYVVEQLGETHYIFARNAGGAPTVGYPCALGITERMIRIAEDPDGVAEGKLKSVQNFGERVKLALDRGADAFCCGEDFGHTGGPFVSPATFRKVFFPALKAQCEQIKAAGSPVLFHSCGNLKLILDQMVEAGVDCYQAIQEGEPLDEYKRTYGDRLTLWGGVLTHTLSTGTPDDVRREARFSVKHCAPGGGFILGSSHSLIISTRYDNYMAMLDVAHKEGTYPIQI